MNFKEMRMRASVVLDKMLEQLEQKDEYTPAEAGVLEKAVKIIDLLEDAEGRSGKSTGLENLDSGDLEAAFDAD